MTQTAKLVVFDLMGGQLNASILGAIVEATEKLPQLTCAEDLEVFLSNPQGIAITVPDASTLEIINERADQRGVAVQHITGEMVQRLKSQGLSPDEIVAGLGLL